MATSDAQSLTIRYKFLHIVYGLEITIPRKMGILEWGSRSEIYRLSFYQVQIEQGINSMGELIL